MKSKKFSKSPLLNIVFIIGGVFLVMLSIYLFYTRLTLNIYTNSDVSNNVDTLEHKLSWKLFQDKGKNYSIEYFTLSDTADCRENNRYPKEYTGKKIVELVPEPPCGPGFSINVVSNKYDNIKDYWLSELDKSGSLKCDMQTNICSEEIQGQMKPQLIYEVTNIGGKNAVIVKPTSGFTGATGWVRNYIEVNKTKIIVLYHEQGSSFDTNIQRMIKSIRFQ